ncbi:hypothetical protein [Salinispira pacifica]|uniref:hypothetical protein n=1 Tax=Salinispira pacifica TaxID=1307761 RepID=UPI0011840E4E|nr:hypothetical protein [Salinispira pacifica]
MKRTLFVLIFMIFIGATVFAGGGSENPGDGGSGSSYKIDDHTVTYDKTTSYKIISGTRYINDTSSTATITRSGSRRFSSSLSIKGGFSTGGYSMASGFRFTGEKTATYSRTVTIRAGESFAAYAAGVYDYYRFYSGSRYAGSGKFFTDTIERDKTFSDGRTPPSTL